MNKEDKELFSDLLHKTGLFDEKSQQVVKSAFENNTMPEVDAEYLLYVMKMEQNLKYLVDSRIKDRLDKLKKDNQNN